MSFTITWNGTGRQAQCPTNPNFPDGMDLTLIPPTFYMGQKTCKAELPYPAAEIGKHLVHCNVCGLDVVVTAAGRPDDPKSVTVVCRTDW
jgi:hypothetical protein